MRNEWLIVVDVTPIAAAVERGAWSTRAKGQKQEVMAEKSR